jgi:dihydroorotase
MKYDVLIGGGEVVDPGAGLRGALDVGIFAGRVVEVAPALRVEDARRVISAKGLYVTPGLVDVHAHVFVNSSDMGENTDRFCNAGGVTTVCDAGSTGSATFAGLRLMLDRGVRTRARAFVNLSAIGIVGTARCGELAHFPYADPEGCARTIAENRDIAIGVKLRYGPGLVWEYTTEPVKMARRAADMAGVPMMIHITDTPLPLPEILACMKPGDIVTHCFHGREHGIMGPQKQLVLREVVEAQRHGIVFDCAHGRGGHFNFPLIEKALDQGFLPDTISTDLTFTTATGGPVWDLTTTMSKLLHFGVGLDEVVRRATATPAKILGLEGEVGTLRPGARADVALLELRDGDVELRDTDGNAVVAKRRLLARTTLRDGRVCWERPAE